MSLLFLHKDVAERPSSDTKCQSFGLAISILQNFEKYILFFREIAQSHTFCYGSKNGLEQHFLHRNQGGWRP
jgi:hypothetical protein